MAAYIDALATASQKHVYFHAINRGFEQPLDIAVDVSAFDAETLAITLPQRSISAIEFIQE